MTLPARLLRDWQQPDSCLPGSFPGFCVAQHPGYLPIWRLSERRSAGHTEFLRTTSYLCNVLSLDFLVFSHFSLRLSANTDDRTLSQFLNSPAATPSAATACCHKPPSSNASACCLSTCLPSRAHWQSSLGTTRVILFWQTVSHSYLEPSRKFLARPGF